MAKIKCPQCGNEIELDKNSYNELLNDIASEEVDKRVKEQTRALEETYKAKLALEQTKAKADQDKELATLKEKYARLEEQLKNSDSKTQLEVNKANALSQEKLNLKEQENIKLKADIDKLRACRGYDLFLWKTDACAETDGGPVGGIAWHSILRGRCTSRLCAVKRTGSAVPCDDASKGDGSSGV